MCGCNEEGWGPPGRSLALVPPFCFTRRRAAAPSFVPSSTAASQPCGMRGDGLACGHLHRDTEGGRGRGWFCP